MVHLVPMNWTDHAPGEPVSVWAYSTVDTVELFLNGRSLGVKRFDHKQTLSGHAYLETTEPTGDDKTVTGGPFPGSYTSPNGSAGKLHLTWDVPFAPGQLVAVAKRDGVEVARDVVATAGRPDHLRLTPDRRTLVADGSSLAFVTVDVVDRNGVVVPSADNSITFTVHNGQLVGLDNGRQESAENYKARTRMAFNGKALAIVQAGDRAGSLSITATSPGLRAGRVSIGGDDHSSTVDTLAAPAPPAVSAADASFSGAPTMIPAAMLDGDLATGWSNFYNKQATALLPAISSAHASEWVSVSLPSPRRIGQATAFFTIDAAHGLPAAITVSYWNGRAFVPVGNPVITWASGSNQPTTITFDSINTSRIRLDLTSRSPNTATGFLQLTELQI